MRCDEDTINKQQNVGETFTHHFSHSPILSSTKRYSIHAAAAAAAARMTYIHIHIHIRDNRVLIAPEKEHSVECVGTSNAHTHWHTAISLLAVAKDHNQFVWFSTPVNVAQVQLFLCASIRHTKYFVFTFCWSNEIHVSICRLQIKIYQIVSFIEVNSIWLCLCVICLLQRKKSLKSIFSFKNTN